jgi:hypothetical protein
LTDTLGADPFDAAGERALGTVLGILVAAVAFGVFREPGPRRPADGLPHNC